MVFLIFQKMISSLFEGADLVDATKETLESSIAGLDSSDAQDIINARDLVPAQPPDTGLDTMDQADAENEVATFGQMVDWDVNQVLRFINAVDAELFDEVKDKFKALGFDGE